jgi:D-alanine-D-alanine ligase
VIQHDNKNKSGYGKVAVLMGGRSAERDISLQSGQAVLDALRRQGVDAHGYDVDRNIAVRLLADDIERVFIVLHGRGGEDGTIQGMLETLEIPYTGSGVFASSLAMDKLKTKQIWQANNLPTPEYQVLQTQQDCDAAIKQCGLPLIVKPVLEGSSIGMTKVESEDELLPAMQTAIKCKGDVIAERWITGTEYTAAFLGDEVLPMIQLKTSHKFYDYEAKYVADDTQYICPCGLDADKEAELARLVCRALDIVHVDGWGRVDFMLDEDLQPWLIEVNTVPGMTSHSLVPMAAKQAGYSFDQLVLKILSTASCKLID